MHMTVPQADVGAGEGNRTLVFSLEGVRRLHAFKGRSDKSIKNRSLNSNGFSVLSERGPVDNGAVAAQAQHLRRTFGLPLPTATLLAELAFDAGPQR
ncbi:hypothetical protein [Bradyrhizobium sp. USDA 4502]